jgi:uncharacterized caspase-like protein
MLHHNNVDSSNPRISIMFKLRSGALGAVKYALPLAALVAVAFGISLAVGKLAPEPAKPALGKVPVLQAAASASRVALIIGNANYPESNAPLAHPVTDAQALAQQLRRSGFAVDLQTDVGKDEMKRVVETFKAKIKPGAVALISFGGLGIQAGRESYMIPVDAHIWREADVRRDGVSIDSLLADMHARGASVKLAILDASRRNPFERRFRGLSAGLAAIDAPLGTLLLSAAAPGKVVADGDGTHSLLIGELLKEINAPGVGAATVFTQTRVGVSRASNGEQTPLVFSSLTESFAFVGTAPREVKAIDGTEMLRPAMARAETADTTIVWAAETSEAADKAGIIPAATESKPEYAVTTSNAPQYEIATRPVETPVQYETASRPIETPAPSVKEPKLRKSVEEAKLPRRPSDEISRESAREQPRVTARRDGSYAASPSERDWRVATVFPRRPAPMLFLGVGY